MCAQTARSLYREGHAADTLLGAFTFGSDNAVSVFVNAHRGDAAEVVRSVEHELAHRSLALDSDFGAVQIALAMAMIDRPNEPNWASWLADSVESSWAAYEGFALQREAWIGAIHGMEFPGPTQARYRDAALQYDLLCSALPNDLKPLWYIFSRAVADYALNFSLAGVRAQSLLTPEGIRAFLRDERRRADSRLGRLSTSIERHGFDNVTLDRVRGAIASTHKRLGSFAADSVQAYVESFLAVQDDRRRYFVELERAITPLWYDCFTRTCPELPFDPVGAERARFLDEVRRDLGVPVPRIGRNTEAPWPHNADVYSVQHVYRGRFDHEATFPESDDSVQMLRDWAESPNVAAYAIWAVGSTVCVLAFMDGPNQSSEYDPLRVPAATRRLGDGEHQTMRLSGERFFITEATSRSIEAIASKVLGALHADDEASAIVSGGEWISGDLVHHEKYSTLVLLLAALRKSGCTELSLVLKTPEIVYIATRDFVGSPLLIELPTTLIGIIRAEDPSLYEWFAEASVDRFHSNDDLSSWGYLFASMVLAGALEPSLGAEDRD